MNTLQEIVDALLAGYASAGVDLEADGARQALLKTAKQIHGKPVEARAPLVSGLLDKARATRSALGGDTIVPKGSQIPKGIAGGMDALAPMLKWAGPAALGAMGLSTALDIYYKEREHSLARDQMRNEQVANAMLVQGESNRAARQQSAADDARYRQENMVRDMMASQTRGADMDRLAALYQGNQGRLAGWQDAMSFEGGPDPTMSSRRDLADLARLQPNRSVLAALGIR